MLQKIMQHPTPMDMGMGADMVHKINSFYTYINTIMYTTQERRMSMIMEMKSKFILFDHWEVLIVVILNNEIMNIVLL